MLKVAVQSLVELLAALDRERVRYGLACEVTEDPRRRVQPEYRREGACPRISRQKVRKRVRGWKEEGAHRAPGGSARGNRRTRQAPSRCPSGTPPRGAGEA